MGMCQKLLIPRRMGGFSPLSYGSDLALWLDPSYGIYTDRSTQLTAASSQYWSVASNSTLQCGGDISFTFAGWVSRTSIVGYDMVFSKGLGLAAGGEYDLFFDSATNALNWRVRKADDSGSAIVTSAAISLGAFTFLEVWHDATNDQIGIRVNNGTAVTASIANGGALASTNAFNFGNYAGGTNYLDGKLDSWMFWKRLLTSDERASIYNAGAGKVAADLTAAEQVSLVSAYDFDGDGLDSHGTNDLTGTNAPTYASGIASGTAGDGDVESLLTPRVGGNGTPPSYAARPIWTAGGGKPYHLFDGSNDSISFGDLAAWDRGTGNFTLCFAAKGGDANDVLIAKDNWAGADNGFLIYRGAADVRYWNGVTDTGFGADSGAACIYTIVRSGTGAGQTALRRNGVEITTIADARTLSNSKALVFGDSADAGHTLNGRLGDVVFCTTNLSAAQLSQLEAWAAARQAA